jgi:hypothetical protein
MPPARPAVKAQRAAAIRYLEPQQRSFEAAGTLCAVAVLLRVSISNRRLSRPRQIRQSLLCILSFALMTRHMQHSILPDFNIVNISSCQFMRQGSESCCALDIWRPACVATP